MLRTAAVKIVSALGVVGGCNIQLALDPKSKQYYVIEVNSIPGFTALQKVTDINIPEKIISYFLENVKD